MEISISGTGLLCAMEKLLPTQLRRIMRLTALLLTVVCLQVHARSYSQMVSFTGRNVPLKVVLASLEKQTGLSFFFNYATVRDTRPVTLDVRDVALDEVLNAVLRNQGLDYYEEGKTVFIVKKQVNLDSSKLASIVVQDDAGIDVSGTVTNSQGEPLVGASVVLKSGNKATITNEHGTFRLKGIPIGAVLEISYLGYTKETVKIGSDGRVNVELMLANSQLDQAQVIAYGRTTQRLTVGNITTIKSDVIARQPVTNPLLALEGLVPGLYITQSTGLPGSGVTPRIQGQNSMGQGNIPFYVVDGVPYVQTLLTNLNGTIGTSGNASSGSPFSYINPSDIESITVLKDADATAIYGSRAANGAILITTKKGGAGKSKVDVNFQDGFGEVAHRLSLLNTPQFLQMRHEAMRNDGIISPNPNADYDLTLWDTTRNTNWQKVLIGGKAQYMDVNSSISGGTALTQYLIGATYHDETSVFPGSFSDRKGGMHFNLNTMSSNQRLKISLLGDYLIDNNQLPVNDLTTYAAQTAPDAPALHNADGTLNWAPTPAGASSWTNPLAYTYNHYQNKVNNLIANSVLSYQIMRGLDFRTSLGYNYMQLNETVTIPLLSYAPEKRATSVRASQFATTNLNSWIVEPQLSYSHGFDKGKLEILAGSTINRLNSSEQQILATGFSSDQSLLNLLAASSLSVQNDVNTVYKYFAGFARINFNWDDKYIVDLNGRRDGSSRFGPANEYHDFWSAGAGWIFSNEVFFKDKIDIISFGKLRASYGATGNDQISDYKFLNLYNPVPVTVAYQGITGMLPNGLTNPYLEWEETKKFNVGLDLGMMKDRILLNLNYFTNRSSNELLAYKLPIITGFSQITENFPATVENSGWEISLNTTNIKSKSFLWTLNFNITVPKNRLVRYPGLATSSNAQVYVIGQPVSILKAYHYLGVNAQTGAYQFSDGHGGVTSRPDTNSKITQTALINTLPRVYGGIDNTFSYKGFTLDFLFQFVKKTGPRFYFGQTLAPPGYKLLNEPSTVLKRWQRSGDVAPIGRYNSNLSLINPYVDVSNFSDAAYGDDSFLRLKNASISYRMRMSKNGKNFLQDLRIYIQGQNLLTFTKYKGYDPESASVINLPPLRVITAGVNFTF